MIAVISPRFDVVHFHSVSFGCSSGRFPPWPPEGASSTFTDFSVLPAGTRMRHTSHGASGESGEYRCLYAGRGVVSSCSASAHHESGLRLGLPVITRGYVREFGLITLSVVAPAS